MNSLADQTRWLDATGQAELLASGEVKSGELVEAAVERIEQLDPALGAVTLRYFDQARTAVAAGPTGPLAGVPFLIKDLLTDVAGQVCTDANVALKAHARQAAADSPLVARYRAAGLIFVGRTASSEFGTVPAAESAAWGATRNPWNTALSPGGSSGGSAAAVAAGMVPIAHGTDAAGSIRIPASCCGLVALKPSRASRHTTVESVQDLIVPSAVTRSVRDTALLLDIAHGVESPAPTGGYLAELGADPGRLRVGLLDTQVDGSPVHPDCAEAVRAAARLLESLGHHVDPGFPAALGDSALDGLLPAFWSSGMADVLGDVARQLGRDVTEAEVEPLNWALGTMGTEVTAEDRQAARDGVADFARSVVSWWDDHDLLLTPTLAEPPLPSGTLGSDPADPLAPLRRSVQFAPFTPFVNFTGQPAISLPLHANADGLPIGVQLVAAPGREDLLLRVAALLETAAPWQDRRPAL
ncbi:amidase [Streptomyces iconiensis]|uniref:Amidase family protein n=1 Tax=Streptomyces iconiensis TaxID=1384038 RepID=A0ABT7A8R9_9ACTN|nr:amidase family protein [Streptomyces iconiensis]MDJ1137231.1 amidase family protein [Streptomyces iconiensis]